MARKRKGRAIDGVLLLNKSSGVSSNFALQKVKRLFNAQKAGHTGSLDPLASGLLPICLGQASKYAQYLLDADKAYRAKVMLGVTTDSADADGEMLERVDASALQRQQVEAVCEQFTGPQQQVPPMFSALKVDGQPLYKLARQGITLELKARDVTISSLVVEDYQSGEQALLTIDVACTKGTYIRSLARDIGAALNVGGHIVELLRTRAGQFDLANASTLEQLQSVFEESEFAGLDACLLPIEAMLTHIDSCEVDTQVAKDLMLGKRINSGVKDQPGLFKLIHQQGEFIGLAERDEYGVLHPKRMMQLESFAL